MGNGATRAASPKDRFTYRNELPSGEASRSRPTPASCAELCLLGKGDSWGFVMGWGTRRAGGDRLRRATLVRLAASCAAACLACLAGSASAAGYSLFDWGNNSNGQLGRGTTETLYSPMAVPGLTEVVGVSENVAHAVALLSDGTVVAWGSNEDGQLGDGTTEPSDVPVPVANLEHVTAVSVGGRFSLALLANGTVMAWGLGADGQLGDGNTESSVVPVPVSNLEGVVEISGGNLASLARLSNGTVMAWGGNPHGQLGDGSTESSDIPVSVEGLTGVTAISAGGGQSLALLAGGAVRAWGYNEFGELGNGTFTDSDVPTAVRGLEAGVSSISAGDEYNLALMSDGTLKGWGRNEYGELGNGQSGHKVRSDEPVPVSNLSEVKAASAGQYASLALLDDGDVAAWGGNEKGELGIGTGGKPKLSAVPILIPTLCNVAGVSAGDLSEFAYGEASPECPIPPVLSKLKPKSGSAAGGTTVTITGTGFTGATAVKFGDTLAKAFKVESSTTIEAESPAGTGKVDVTVTTGGGTSATSSKDRFTYKK